MASHGEKFTMSYLFKDGKTEKKFLKAHLTNLKEIGKIYLLAIIVIFLIYLGYLIYRRYELPGMPPLTISIPIDVVFLVVPIANYYLAIKYEFFQKNFSNIQILTFHIVLLEMSINGDTPNVYSLIFKELPIILLCLMSYNQTIFFFLLLLCYIYNVARSSFWITSDYLYSILAIEYLFFVFICMVISRINIRKDRLAF